MLFILCGAIVAAKQIVATVSLIFTIYQLNMKLELTRRGGKNQLITNTMLVCILGHQKQC
jgi:hypothetical protein